MEVGNKSTVQRIDPTMGHISRLKELCINKENPAKWTHERLGVLVKDFESELDEEHEVGLKVVSFGNSNAYHVESIGYWGPDIVIFHCVTTDQLRADLVQHHSQLSFLLVALPKLNPDQPTRRIGFSVDDDP